MAHTHLGGDPQALWRFPTSKPRRPRTRSALRPNLLRPDAGNPGPEKEKFTPGPPAALYPPATVSLFWGAKVSGLKTTQLGVPGMQSFLSGSFHESEKLLSSGIPGGKPSFGNAQSPNEQNPESYRTVIANKIR